MAFCAENGIRGLVIHYRGCGGIDNKKLRATVQLMSRNFLGYLRKSAPCFLYQNLLDGSFIRGKQSVVLAWDSRRRGGKICRCGGSRLLSDGFNGKQQSHFQRIQQSLRHEFYQYHERQSPEESISFPGNFGPGEN